jgi:hypothetical protein
MYVKDIRQQLQKKLGLSIYKLVENVLDSEISIIETGKNVKLKKLTLTHLPFEKCRIWRINLETRIPGLSTANKTGEIALVILKNNYLNVYLIELKSMIKDTTLNAIQEKIQDSINRFYFLLLLNSDKDHEIFKNLKIRFIALVFFDGHDKTTSTTEPIYKIFKKRGGQLACNTLLEKGLSIPIKFFSDNFDKTQIIGVRVKFILTESWNLCLKQSSSGPNLLFKCSFNSKKRSDMSPRLKKILKFGKLKIQTTRVFIILHKKKPNQINDWALMIILLRRYLF